MFASQKLKWFDICQPCINQASSSNNPTEPYHGSLNVCCFMFASLLLSVCEHSNDLMFKASFINQVSVSNNPTEPFITVHWMEYRNVCCSIIFANIQMIWCSNPLMSIKSAHTINSQSPRTWKNAFHRMKKFKCFPKQRFSFAIQDIQQAAQQSLY